MKIVESRILIVFATLCFWACDGGKDGSAPSLSLALDELSGPGCAVTLNRGGPFLTSPAWLADGRILARGFRGKGVYIVSMNGEPPSAVRPAYTGHVAWIEKGRSFCLSFGGNSEVFDLDVYSGKLKPTRFEGGTCEPGQGMESQERVMYASPGLRVVYDTYRGGIRIVEQGAEKELEAFGAWGVAVSPDGRRLAYAMGPLRTSVLFVHDSEKGKTILGPGVYPSWFPDGRRLVFAAHEVKTSASGESRVIRSDLVVYDVETSGAIILTDTPNIVEMQPDVSPSGEHIACSDWESGAILVLAAGKEAAP